jgi:hypothetical protein
MLIVAVKMVVMGLEEGGCKPKSLMGKHVMERKRNGEVRAKKSRKKQNNKIIPRFQHYS